MSIELHNGDCLEVMATLPDNSIDMVMTDPPYGTTACKWDSVIPLEPMWEQLKRITKPNGAIVMTASQPFTTSLISDNLEMFKYSLVWCKSQSTGHLNAWRMPMRAHEDVLVFYAKPPTYTPELKDKPPANIRPASKRAKKCDCYGAHKGSITRCPQDKTMPSSLIYISNAQSKSHPTQKPVALMEYLISAYTSPADNVLDFTMGSGTTGVACVNLGRSFIGIERDEGYFAVAKDRIAMAECPADEAQGQFEL